MKKIGQFIYPWGNGHYTRMMRLDDALPKYLSEEFDMHYFSKGEIYKKLLKKFPDKLKNIHEVLMPTPIDGRLVRVLRYPYLTYFFRWKITTR